MGGGEKETKDGWVVYKIGEGAMSVVLMAACSKRVHGWPGRRRMGRWGKQALGGRPRCQTVGLPLCLFSLPEISGCQLFWRFRRRELSAAAALF